jgi:hypothetical protein
MSPAPVGGSRLGVVMMTRRLPFLGVIILAVVLVSGSGPNNPQLHSRTLEPVHHPLSINEARYGSTRTFILCEA